MPADLPTPAVTLRPLAAPDAPAYLALFLRAVEAHPETFRITADDLLATPVPFAPAHPDRFTLGAFDASGALVGTAAFARDGGAKMRHKALLYRMYVAAEAAGHGVGRALVRDVVARARALGGVEQVLLNVVATNERARALYASEGFVAYGREPRAIRHGSGFLDEEAMVLFLL